MDKSFARDRLRKRLQGASEKRLSKDARLLIRAKALDTAEASPTGGLADPPAAPTAPPDELDFEDLARKTLSAVIQKKKEDNPRLTPKDVRLIQEGVRAAFAENPIRALDMYGLIGEKYEHLRTSWRKTIEYLQEESHAMGGGSGALAEVARQAHVEDAIRTVQEELRLAAEKARVSEEDALASIAELELSG